MKEKINLYQAAIKALLKNGFLEMETPKSSQNSSTKIYRKEKTGDALADPRGTELMCAVYRDSASEFCILIDVFSFIPFEKDVIDFNMLCTVLNRNSIKLSFRNASEIQRFFKSQLWL